ncbi:MAG: acyl-CoA thioesterase [Ignavibacteriales bacterium]|nr:acyl-CoA thioesterase [Ignavibacteriales bacterium]
MLTNKTKIRVRYADTDKMQIVYNGKYLEYFEVGRTELLRNLGLPYSEIEKMGYQLPLIEAYIKYHKPAKYDDILEIEANINKIYSAVLHIEYKIKHENGKEILISGFTNHVFINEKTKKATKPPDFFIELVNKNAVNH